MQDQSALYYDFTRTHRRGCVTLTHTLINITPLVSTEYFDDYSTAVAATWLRYRPGQATKGVKGLGALGSLSTTLGRGSQEKMVRSERRVHVRDLWCRRAHSVHLTLRQLEQILNAVRRRVAADGGGEPL